jgi:uncharacterized protein (DUF849 family)
VAGPRSNLLRPERRVEHVVALRPEICTLDLNTMTFGREVEINVPWSAQRMAEMIHDAGVKPELELFDTGDIAVASDLLAEGALRSLPMVSLVTGIRYGFPSTPDVLATAARLLPRDAGWNGFGFRRMASPMLALAFLLGEHIQTNIKNISCIAKGQLCRGNAELVARGRDIIEKLGGEIADPGGACRIMGLPE